MGVEVTDFFITLKPRDAVEEGPDPGRADRADRRTVPRPARPDACPSTQPIEQRINEMISGVRADVAVKLFGDDLDILLRKGATRSRRCCATIPGSGRRERRAGHRASPSCRFASSRTSIARYGVPAKAVLDLVESVGSKPLGEVVEGQTALSAGGAPAREAIAADADAARQILRADRRRASASRCPGWPTSTWSKGPSTITREWGQRRIVGRRATSAAATWAASSPRPGRRSRTRCHCRRAATASNGAASSRTSSAPEPGC